MSRVDVDHALDVETAFQEAMDMAEKDGGDANGGVKWAIVCIVNRLRDEGHTDEESLDLAEQCFREVSQFITALDDRTPIIPFH